MGIEYFDLKNPEAERQYAEYDGFQKYLQSMGFSIKEIPDEGNIEEGVLSCSYAISGNGLDLLLSNEEYTQLQSSSGDLIYSYLWKKQNKIWKWKTHIVFLQIKIKKVIGDILKQKHIFWSYK